MSKLARLFIHNRHIVILSMVFVVIFGAYSYIMIPKQENPNTILPAAMITTVYPGATSTDVEEMVTRKIETRLNQLPNIDELRSYSVNSASVVIVIFKIDVDPLQAMTAVREAVNDVQKDLPPLALASDVRTDLAEVPQFILSLSNDRYSIDDLASYAMEIQQALEAVSGVVRVEVDGNLTRQVVINVNIDDLYLYRISMETLVALLQAQNLNIPSGSIDYDSSSINVNTPATFESLRDIENIVISGSEQQVGFVRLKDVATVSIEPKSDYYFRHNNQNAVLLTGYFEPGTNAVLIGREVRKVIEEQKQYLPPDIVFHELVFSPEDINSSINNFIYNLLQSIALIVVIVMIGVRFRNALVVSISLPLSILISLITMFLLDIEFHFISIAALIISLGILVDNAIVISEAIQQRLNAGEEKMEAIEAAVQETARPIFTSTLTTIIAFGTIMFIPGIIGRTVATIPIVVISTLLASYFVAMLIIPIFAYIFFKPESRARIDKVSSSWIKRFFEMLLNLGLQYPRRAIAVAFATLLIAALLFSQLGMSFFPYSDKPMIYINVNNESLNLAKTGQVHDQVLEVLAEFDEVVHVVSAVGSGVPRFFITAPLVTPSPDTAQLVLQLDYRGSSYQSNEELGFAIQQALDQRIIGAKVEVKYLEYSMPTEAKLVLNLSGPDLEDLIAASLIVQEKLAEMPGTIHVRDNFTPKQYEYVVRIDEDYLATSGILKYDIVKQINTALMGATPSSYRAGGAEMDILVKADIRSLDDLYRLPIQSSVTDVYMQLNQLASVDIQATLPSIYRQNRQRTITVLSDVLPGYSAVKTELDFKRLYGEDILPEGVTISYTGELKNIMDLISNLGYSAAAALGLIYMVLLVQFKKFSKPWIILTSVPLSLTGVFLGLFVFQVDIQAMALLGAVSLFGIVVNNGIILTEVMDEGVRQGLSVKDACRQAVGVRYRPILLTAITTCAGLVPLILTRDPMSSPMALVLFFGLIVSTVLTMVIVPVLYYLTVHNTDEAAVAAADASS